MALNTVKKQGPEDPKLTPSRKARWLARRGVLLCAAVALFATATGCGPTVISLRDVPRQEWTVLVLPLNDYYAERLVLDYTFYGRTGGQGSGPVIARSIRRAMDAHGGFKLASTEDRVAIMRRDNFLVDDIARHLPDARVCEMARELNAGMVIRGDVHKSRTAWAFFVPRASIDLELRGIDAKTCELLWRTTIKKRRWWRTDTALTEKCAKSVVSKLAKLYLPIQ